MEKNCKRMFLACVAAAVFVFLFEWLFHGKCLERMYMETAQLWRPKDQMICWAMIAAQIMLPFVAGCIFLKGYENKGIMEGVRFGFLLGLFFVPSSLAFYAVMPIPLMLGVWWAVGGIIEMIGVGVIFAAIYKPK